jgi:hypothetical protein
MWYCPRPKLKKGALKMASINKIKPGQILYDYHKYKMGNSTMRTEGCWPVEVLEVDLENRKACCSWNGNPPRWYYEEGIKRLRVKMKG